MEIPHGATQIKIPNSRSSPSSAPRKSNTNDRETNNQEKKVRPPEKEKIDEDNTMEASRFGFNLPPSYKFDPTDTDIVAHYLLPRAVGFPNPYAHAVIDADPCSCPPWELMRRHGHGDTDQALFIGPPRDPERRNKRADRTVAAGEDDGVGGTWDGQKSELTRLVLLRGGAGGGGEMEITYKRHHLSYYHDDDGGGARKKKKRRSSTSGWVMYDYQIVEPEHLSGVVLSRIKITDRSKKTKKKKKKGKRKQPAAGGELMKVVLPPGGPDQAGPSNYYLPPGPDEAGPSNYYAAPGQEQVGPSNYYAQPGPDEAGPSKYYDAPPVTGGEEYGGFVMGDDTGGCYVGGGGSNYTSYEGYGCYSNQVDGNGGGDCLAAGDETTGGSYVGGGGGEVAAGDFMGETTSGGSYVNGSDDYLNFDMDFGCNFGVDDDYCFNFGDNSSFGYPDGGNNGG
ncbi:hypothetical protein HU200_016884 [Digitaria exilis]|uniref:NAC domain-containing protein n=1 Tax=Digitaria exilis TaxID=1010633 RepID=A0A835KH22_9POAL|nr:hypothetical protein HU200_016884 [Digitaria exilis]